METSHPNVTKFPAGTTVRILSDDWNYNGVTAIMIDPEPVLGSSQCKVQIDGEIVTIPINDVFPFEPKKVNAWPSPN